MSFCDDSLGILWIMWLIAAATITSALGGGFNCGGINFRISYCNQLNALEAWSWITWYVPPSLSWIPERCLMVYERFFITLLFIAIIALAVRASRRGEDPVKGPINPV